MKFMRIKHFLLAAALAGAAPFAAAAFQANMTLEQAEAEVRAQMANSTLQQIAQRALDAKLDPSLVTTAIINATSSPISEVVTAVLRAGAPLQAVVNGALAAGATREDVIAGALAANVQLPTVVAAINTSTTGGGGATGGAGAGGSIGAGSGGSVSPS
jgi:hypothetical protein